MKLLFILLLGLGFTQNISTQAYDIPVSFFAENYTYIENDENSNATAYRGTFDLSSFIDVNRGYTTYGFLKNCNDFQNFTISFENNECETPDGQNQVSFYCWDGECNGGASLYFNCPVVNEFYLYYGNDESINPECSMELWVVSDSHNGNGLIDELENEINELENELEELNQDLQFCEENQGDMNNDGALNVYDVLILVGIILDGDSGDIFDVMEIIKRV